MQKLNKKVFGIFLLKFILFFWKERVPSNWPDYLESYWTIEEHGGTCLSLV